jgi:hypothetical protein
VAFVVPHPSGSDGPSLRGTNVGIALIEAFVPERSETPWLGRTGLGVTAALFAVGVALVTWGSYRDERFFAAGLLGRRSPGASPSSLRVRSC